MPVSVRGRNAPLRNENTLMRLAHNAAKLIIGGIFLYAAFDKIAHPAAFAKDVYNYQILPDAVVNLVALVLPWIELFAGACLLTGVWVPGAVLITNGLLLIFLAALVLNYARGLDVNCGCFSTGDTTPAMSIGWYLLRDALFMMIGALLFCTVFFQAEKNRADRSRPSVPSI
jgi:hypothetical protein